MHLIVCFLSSSISMCSSLPCRPYLNKLPAKFSEEDKILITDPMLATGGTILQVTYWVGHHQKKNCVPVNIHGAPNGVPKAMLIPRNHVTSRKIRRRSFTQCFTQHANAAAFIMHASAAVRLAHMTNMHICVYGIKSCSRCKHNEIHSAVQACKPSQCMLAC